MQGQRKNLGKGHCERLHSANAHLPGGNCHCEPKAKQSPGWPLMNTAAAKNTTRSDSFLRAQRRYLLPRNREPPAPAATDPRRPAAASRPSIYILTAQSRPPQYATRKTDYALRNTDYVPPNPPPAIRNSLNSHYPVPSSLIPLFPDPLIARAIVFNRHRPIA